MTRALRSTVVLLLAFVSVGPVVASTFNKMSVETDDSEVCEAPRPPVDLNSSAYIRNGYRAILRIMAAERWQDTGNCTCYLTQIGWEDVIADSPSYATSSNPVLPYDVIAMNRIADELEIARMKACGH